METKRKAAVTPAAGRRLQCGFCICVQEKMLLPYIFYKSCYGTIFLRITDVCVNKKLTYRALKLTPAQQVATLTERLE